LGFGTSITIGLLFASTIVRVSRVGPFIVDFLNSRAMYLSLTSSHDMEKLSGSELVSISQAGRVSERNVPHVV